MNIAIIKNYGLDISSDARMFIVGWLRNHGFPHIYSLSPGSLAVIYNQAFGAASQDGVAAIATAFSEAVTASQMKQETVQRFYTEFYAIVRSLFDEFKSIKLTTRR